MNPLQVKAPVLFEFARFIQSGNHSFDAATLHQAKRVAADTIGVLFSGVKTEAFKRALEQKSRLFGKGSFGIWGTTEETVLSGAVFYNALAISSTDFDEGHRKAVGHPASLIVPVAFTLGESLKCSYNKILESIIIGYETATRFSHARIPEKIDTYSSGRWGAVGTAATVAYLLELDIEQTMHALSNAWILSPVMLGGSTDVSTGSMSKEGVAWAIQSGLQSALLAEKDFVGPYLFVDNHDDLDSSNLLEGLGESWLINSNYFKPYACCRWLHAAVEAADLIRRKHHFMPADITEIEIKIFGRAIDLVDEKFPRNPVQAQFHLPYVVACLLINDHVLPEHFSINSLKNEQIKALVDRATLTEEKRYNDVFPAELPSSVTIKTEKNTFYEEVLTAPWDAGCPPSEEELKEKFLLQTGEEKIPLWNILFSEETKPEALLKLL